MKTLIQILLLGVALTLVGCSSIAKRAGKDMALKSAPPIQQILDIILPMGFEGDVNWNNTITGYTTFTLKVGNVRPGANGWLFDSFSFIDLNPLWHGDLTLSPKRRATPAELTNPLPENTR